MARYIREIISPRVFMLREHVTPLEAIAGLLRHGVSAAPVVDDEGRPLGVTTLRDLAEATVKSVISRPAVSVSSALSVEEAARTMANGVHHQLVVVGSDGRVVGMLSSFNLLRAILGLPPHYPSRLRPDDRDVPWSNLEPFDAEHVTGVDAGAGVLVLSTGGVAETECDLWAEAALDLHARLEELLAGKGKRSPSQPTASLLEHESLHFRCAFIAADSARNSVADRLRARIAHAPFPHATVPTDG